MAIRGRFYLHVLDVGLALDYVCRQIKSHHPEFKCVKLRIPYKSCSTKDQMLFYYDQLKNYENLVTACVTCISIIKDFRIPNAVIPVCECIMRALCIRCYCTKHTPV